VERFPGGLWWVELAPLADPTAVPTAALSAAGGAHDPLRPTVEQIADRADGRPMLLVLDNCEHVIGAAASLAGALIAASPHVSVLATSREPLGVPGEVTWRVPSLPAPPVDRPLSIDALSQFEAVRLFVDRAGRARPNFTVTEGNAPAIAQLCHRLD